MSAGLEEYRRRDGELVIVRWVWETDASGNLAVYLEQPINGTLQRYTAYHSDSGVGGTNYAVYLYDPFETGGADELLGKCNALTYNATGTDELVKTLGSPNSGVRGMFLLGNHRLVVKGDAAESTAGVFELRYVERYSLGSDVASVL